LQLSSNALTLSQGNPSTISVSVTPQNDFVGTVQVTLSGLPEGVSCNPASPFAVSTGANVALIFGASANAATGTFNVTVAASSGSLSHSATLSLTIVAGVVSALPRTGYVRTDAQPDLDNVPGEPLHRHIAYDAANKHIFVANRAMNRVEVFSTLDQSRAAQISLPAASNADLSADGGTVWVGTMTEQAAAIDAATLQVRARYSISAIATANAVFDRPEELLAMSNSKLMMRLRQPATSQSVLALWDPATNSVSNLTSVAPQIFQNGLGVITHSGDRTKLLVAANDSSGQIAVLDANGNVLAGPITMGTGTIPVAAANGDGSRFAVELVSGSAAQLFLVDSALNQTALPASLAALGLTFSRDAKFLYASQTTSGVSAISVFDGSTLAPLGQVPDPSIQGLHTEIEDVDETQLLFGVSNRGVAFIDASQPASLSSASAAFAAAPVAQPSEGPASGGTTTLVAGQNFEPTAQVKFGSQLSSTANVLSTSQIQVVAPPSVVNAAVNIAAYFPSGWLAIAPDAFAYSPQILEMSPSAGNASGGDTVQLYGYGFGVDASKITVQVGGAAGTVQSVANVTGVAPSLGLDATYPFPLEEITLKTPPGNPGKVDVAVSSPAGNTVQPKAFQYLKGDQVFAKAGLYKFVSYDQKRQWLYLSATDHVDVFDLNASMFKPALSVYCPSLMLPGPCPDAGLRDMALTPDGSQLIIADFGSQNVFLLNPDSPGTVSFVTVGGVAGFSASGPARVATTNVQTAFVGISGESGSGTCTNCLLQLNLAASPPTVQPAPQPQVSFIRGAPLIESDAAGDRVYLAYDVAAGAPLGVWNAAMPNQFTTTVATQSALDFAAAADGTACLMRTNAATEIRDATLSMSASSATAELEQIPGRVLVPGAAMHPSGALLYQPFLAGPAPAAPPAMNVQGGVDILDARTGRLRLRLFLPEPLAMLSTDVDALHGRFLVVDENGRRIFALTTSGLTVIQLASVPLGIGTISPATGAASGGTTVTIRGSGFQNGATVAIGGKSASVTFKDTNTLTVTTPAVGAGPQQIVITNPDGETVTLDAAFVAN
jgi:IPT/TIG domain